MGSEMCIRDRYGIEQHEHEHSDDCGDNSSDLAYDVDIVARQPSLKQSMSLRRS